MNVNVNVSVTINGERQIAQSQEAPVVFKVTTQPGFNAAALNAAIAAVAGHGIQRAIRRNA